MPPVLSDTELTILEYLWSQSEPKTFSEIMNHFNSIENKDWKKQTLNTFLLRLNQKGYLIADKSLGRARYTPSVSKDDYQHQFATQILDESFGSSLKCFISAFTGGQKLSSEEKDELLKYLEEL